METMFVLTRAWGEYSDRGECAVCVCASQEEAQQAKSIMEELDIFSHEESRKFKEAHDEYEKTLGFKQLPSRPKKSEIDPRNLIDNQTWQQVYIELYNRNLREAQAHNAALQQKILEFGEDYKSKIRIPDKFAPFLEYFALSHYWSDYREPHYYEVSAIPVVRYPGK